MTRDDWEQRAPALADKVSFLRRPESFPEGTTGVEAVETHMSWVFLTDHHAYKLKKPVRFQLLNLVTLGLDGNGRLALGSRERVVDWLVKMRRLPARRMLDRLIASGEVERIDILRVAGTLAAFYQRAPPGRDRAEGVPRAFRPGDRRNRP